MKIMKNHMISNGVIGFKKELGKSILEENR